jgi:PKD repeat protein
MLRFMRSTAFLCLVCFSAILLSGPKGHAQSDSALYLPGRLIIKILPAYRAYAVGDQPLVPGLAELIAKLPDGSVQRAFPEIGPPVATRQPGAQMADLSLIFYVAFDPTYPVGQALQRLQKHPALDYVEPWYGQTLFYQPNDPFADTTGGINSMWHLRQIKAREAWEIHRNDTSVMVGIIDSGTGKNHPDLVDNLAYNYDDPIDGLDNDNDGYVDNYQGWDFGGPVTGSLGDNDPSVGNVHGTWVTGIVGATADNGIGLPGICFNCEYLPVKVAPDDALGSIYYGYQGIVYAVQQGAQVVNCSWGGSLRSRFGEDVIQFATVNRQAAVIAACGNSDSDAAFYPAAYERVISVANSTYGDTLFVNSTYHYSVDMAAPGWNIRSTLGNTGYHSWGGTSASAPVVAGAVALVKAHFPDYTGYEAAQRVRVTTDDIYDENPNERDKLGSGRLNMLRALTDAPKPAIRQVDVTPIDLNGDGASRPGDTLELRISLTNHLDPASDLQVSLSLPPSFQNLVELLDSSRDLDRVERRQTRILAPGFRLRLANNFPYDFTLPIRLDYRDSATQYEDFEYVYLTFNRSYLNFSVNRIHSTVNSQGSFGWHDFLYNQEGQGLRYQGQTNVLFEGGFLIGAGPGQVFDRVRNTVGRDNDFFIQEPITARKVDKISAFEAHSRFSDLGAFNALGLEVEHDTYAFDQPGWQHFVLMRYIIHNPSNAPINQLYAGLFADWDIAPSLQPGGSSLTRNACNYDTLERLAFAYDVSGQDDNYYGLSLLSEHPFRSFSLGSSDSNFVFSSAGKYTALSNVPTPATAAEGVSDGGSDIMHFLSGGPFSIAAGGSDTLVFALLADGSYSGLTLHNQEALRAYRCEVLGQGPRLPFTISDSTAAVGDTLRFTDQNTGGQSWFWDFGDGAVATGAAPSHVYAQPGRYLVQLTVSDGYCEATLPRIIEVQTATSLAQADANALALYPNPSRGRFALTATLPAGVVHLSVVNAAGQRCVQAVYPHSGGDFTQQLDLSAQPAGMYQVVLWGEKFHLSQRAIFTDNP